MKVETYDGSQLEMRPIEPSDKGALVDGFNRLSDESRYRRFFAPLDHLSPTDLRYLTEVDHHDHEAIIAFDPETGDTVGVARFVRTETPHIAEVAVTVGDDWHGHGVATAMLEELVKRAREEGITHFLAVILETNEAAIELFEHLAAHEPDLVRRDGNIELLFELPGEDADVRRTALGTALRAAAKGVQMNPWRRLKHRVHETAEHRVPGGDADGAGER